MISDFFIRINGVTIRIPLPLETAAVPRSIAFCMARTKRTRWVSKTRPADLPQIDFEQFDRQAVPAGQAAGQEKLHLVALAVIEAQRLHLFVPSLRPIKRGRRGDPPGEKDEGSLALAHDEL